MLKKKQILALGSHFTVHEGSGFTEENWLDWTARTANIVKRICDRIKMLIKKTICDDLNPTQHQIYRNIIG